MAISTLLFGCFNPEKKRAEIISEEIVVPGYVDTEIVEYHYIKVIDTTYIIRTNINTGDSESLYRLDTSGKIKSNVTSIGMGFDL